MINKTLNIERNTAMKDQQYSINAFQNVSFFVKYIIYFILVLPVLQLKYCNFICDIWI